MRTYQSPRSDPRDLQIYGPRLKIKIGHPLLGSGRQFRFTTTDALIDTGAQRTLLVPEVVEKLGLSKVDETTLLRVGGKVPADVYAASLQFPHCDFSSIEMIAVPCCELGHPLFRCLIGRDVLAHWSFTYNGPLGMWQVTEEDGDRWVEPPESDPGLWGK